jgi:hypothetical protein
MKVYLLKEEDFEKLILILDQDPEHSRGSSQVFSPVEKEAYAKLHRYFNYELRGWIDSVKKP